MVQKESLPRQNNNWDLPTQFNEVISNGGKKEENLHQLISMIYSTAVDPQYWPGLLEQIYTLTSFFDTEQGEQDENVEQLGSFSDQSLLHILSPHLDQALKLSAHTDDLTRLKESSMGILDCLPVAIMLVNDQCMLRMANQQAWKLLDNGNLLHLSGKYLHAFSGPYTLKLHSLIETFLAVQQKEEDDNASRILQLRDRDSSMPASVLITAAGPFVAGKGLAAVLVASPELIEQPSSNNLRTVYGLTKAEACLTASLVQGKTLSDHAKEAGVSRHTVRNQLKSVFDKTGVSRQAELVRLVLTGPTMINSNRKACEVQRSFAAKNIHEVCKEQVIQLRDGRKMALGCYGDFSQKPVFYMHGIDGSRLQMAFDPWELKRLGLHYVIPERPGFGISDPLPGRTLLDWASDMEDAMDFYGEKRYHVAGSNAGGVFALVLGHLLPERLEKITLINCAGPPETLSFSSNYSPFWRMTMGIGRRFPAMFGPFTKILLRGILRNPRAYLDRSSKAGSASERRISATRPGDNSKLSKLIRSDTTLKDFFLSSLREATRQGVEHLAHEASLLVNDWGFILDQIHTPVTLWHGCENTMIPVQTGQYLADQLPNVKTHFLEGEGNYLILNYAEKILSVG